MTTEAIEKILQRKAASYRESGRNGQRALLRAMRLAVALAGTERLELPVAAIGWKQTRRTAEELEELMPSDGLLILLECPAERFAAVTLERRLVEALVQKQTVGEVFGGPPGDRVFTSTDAALIEPFVEGFLDHSRILTEVNIDQQCLRGFRFANHVMSARSLCLSLQAVEYRVFTLQLDLAGGEVQGEMQIMLPDDPLSGAPAGEEGADEQDTLARTLVSAHVDMATALCRVPMTLDALAQIHVGQVLELADASLDRIDLVTRGGRGLVTGRLGRLDGMRAIRLVLPSAEAAQSPALEFAASDEAGISDLAEVDAPGLVSDTLSIGLHPESAAPMVPDLPANSIDDLGDLPELPTQPDLDADMPTDGTLLPALASTEGSLSALGDGPASDDLPELPAIGALDDLPDLPL